MNNEKGNPNLTDPEYLAYWEFEHATTDYYEEAYHEWLENFALGIWQEENFDFAQKFTDEYRWDFVPPVIKELLGDMIVSTT